MTLLYKWLTESTRAQGSAKALVYRDTYLSWRGLSHRVDRRVQEFSAMGIKKGDWVGLMLGNVPDFVILALALSKIGAVVVPLDPTTGVRELEMILEAAPLRALVTRPRGGDGPQGIASAGGASGGAVAGAGSAAYYGGPGPVRALLAPARPPSPPSKFVPENRRRLQGTLLTCSLYRRSAAATFIEAGAAVVQFTVSIGGDPQ